MAMTPLLTIQVLGLYFRFKSRRLEQTADEPVVQPPAAENETEEIIELLQRKGENGEALNCDYKARV